MTTPPSEVAGLVKEQDRINRQTPEERDAEAAQFCRDHPEVIGGGGKPPVAVPTDRAHLFARAERP